MNVGLAFARNAIRHPDEPAVFGSARHTNRELHERSNRIANALLARGLEHGDRVALLVANRPEVVEVLGGVTKADWTASSILAWTVERLAGTDTADTAGDIYLEEVDVHVRMQSIGAPYTP